MKGKILHIVGAVGLALAMGMLSACFAGPYYPAYPRYSYGSPAYGYPEYYPHPATRYVPIPRAYAYNGRPYGQERQGWAHEQHGIHRQDPHHQHHDNGDHDWH
jgi:hypothetical protein